MNICIDSDIENLRVIESSVDKVLNKLSIKEEAYGKILVATMEAVNNAIVHGNKTDKNKNVDVSFDYSTGDFMVTVKDEGSGFNPSKVPDPTAPENIESLNGRGVFLMMKLSDDISFNDEGNEVTMKFKIE